MSAQGPNGGSATSVAPSVPKVALELQWTFRRALHVHVQRALASLLLGKLKDRFGARWWALGVEPLLDSHYKRHKPEQGGEEEWFTARDAPFMFKYILHNAEVRETLFKREFETTMVRLYLEQLLESRNLFDHDYQQPFTKEELTHAIGAAALLLDAFHLHAESTEVRALNKRLDVNIGNVLDLLASGRLPDFDDRAGDQTGRPIVFENVKTLMEELDKGRIKPAQQLIKVSGTYAPRLLLARGWWSRETAEADAETQEAAWKKDDGLQKWLFEGFEKWGPSWDLRVASGPGRAAGKPRTLIGQLAAGDEVNSVCVFLRGEQARKAEGYLEAWGGFEAELTGYLTNRTGELAKLHKSSAAPLLDMHHEECCIVVDDRPGHEVKPRAGAVTAGYTGYLWQCVAPRLWIPEGESIGSLQLDQVLFVWEHIEFTAPRAVDYGLHNLRQKLAYLADPERYGPLVLVHKSDSIVDGDPHYPVKTFSDILEARF